MAFYLVSYNEKSPILWGPYTDQTEMLSKQSSLEGRSEVFDLPTTDRQRAVRMIKAEISKGGELERFQYGKS